MKSPTPSPDERRITNFLAWDIVRQPDLTLQDGRLPVPDGPGLGFDLDWNAVREAADAWWKGVDCTSRSTQGHRFTPTPADAVNPKRIDDDVSDRASDGDRGPSGNGNGFVRRRDVPPD